MTQKQQQVPKPHQRPIRHTQAKQTWENKANSRRKGNTDKRKGLQNTNRAAEPAPGTGTNVAIGTDHRRTRLKLQTTT